MAIRRSLLAACMFATIAQGVDAAELRFAPDGWTAVTISRSGWGAARARSLSTAIALAVDDCRSKSYGASDCGAAIKTIQAGWILALRCGGYRVLTTGETLEDAEEAAAHRILQLKYISNVALPSCFRILQAQADQPETFDARPIGQISRY